MEALTVVKIGGEVIDEEQKLHTFLHDFKYLEGKKILIHGGGKSLTQMAEQLGMRQQLIDGRRVTDAETLKLAVMVYGGYINKKIVAQLQSEQCPAIGLTGADANLIPAVKRPAAQGVDFGFVGNLTEALPTKYWRLLLDNDLVPVMAALTHDGKGQLLNTNADTIAQKIAAALCSFYEVTLVYLFQKPGLLLSVTDDQSLIENIDLAAYQRLQTQSVISDGMIPKLDNAFEALNEGAAKVKIGKFDALEKILNGQAGTTIIKE